LGERAAMLGSTRFASLVLLSLYTTQTVSCRPPAWRRGFDPRHVRVEFVVYGLAVGWLFL
jgi:hypothetical protein